MAYSHFVSAAIGCIGLAASVLKPAWCQTATKLLESGDTMTMYRTIKPAFVMDIYPGMPGPGLPYRYRTGGTVHLAGDCMYDILIGEAVKSQVGRRLRLLALFTNEYDQGLARLGFQKSVFRPAIERLEIESIRTIREPKHWTTDWTNASSHDTAPYARPLREFADTVNRAHAGQRVPTLIAAADLGCGAGEVPVKLRSSPPGGKIYMVEMFEYRVCESLQSGLGEDLRRCDRWHAPSSEEFYPVAGKYRYKIVWPGQAESPSQQYDFSNIRSYTTVTLTAR